MDLDKILNKTKRKAGNAKVNRSPPFIAARERPYDISEIKNNKKPDEQAIPYQHLETLTSLPNGEDLKNESNIRVDESTYQEFTSSAESGNKSGTKWGQEDNLTASINIQTKRKGGQTGDKVGTNRGQSGNKNLTYTALSNLVGVQREIVHLIYQECKKARSKVTEPLTIEYISRFVGTSSDTVKTTLKRLEAKGCVMRVEFKNGRGGWTRYELFEQLYRDILQYETSYRTMPHFNNKWGQSGDKVGTGWERPSDDREPQLDNLAAFPNNMTSIANPNERMNELPFEWDNIDIEPLNGIRFSKNHIAQLYKSSKMAPIEIQDWLELQK